MPTQKSPISQSLSANLKGRSQYLPPGFLTELDIKRFTPNIALARPDTFSADDRARAVSSGDREAPPPWPESDDKNLDCVGASGNASLRVLARNAAANA